MASRTTTVASKSIPASSGLAIDGLTEMTELFTMLFTVFRALEKVVFASNQTLDKFSALVFANYKTCNVS
jgi:hypothetical protein